MKTAFDALQCDKTWLLLGNKGNFSRMPHSNMKTIETHIGISKLNVYKKTEQRKEKKW